MKSRHLMLKLVSAAVLTALAASPVLAQTTGTTTTTTTTTTTSHESVTLGNQFSTFAGSTTNSQSLVQGLRDGTAITLSEPVTTTSSTGVKTTTTVSTTFTPATGPMGYGNVKIALSLAEASLAKAGITDPTAAEMQAALNGGTLVLANGTSIKLDGILAARAAGEGWGQIAKAEGFKLGDVMRSPKGDAHAHTHVKVERVEQVKGHDVDRPSKPEHVAKADRPERPERPNKPERPEHPDHTGRPGG